MKSRSYLALMAAVILVPLIVFSWLAANSLLQRERESRFRAMQEAAQATALAIDQELALAEGSLRVLANTRSIRNGDYESLYELMKSSRTEDSWAVLIDYDAQTLVNTLVPFGTTLPRLRYDWIKPVIDAGKLRVSDYRVGTLSKTAVISVDLPLPPETGRKQMVSQILEAGRFNKLLLSRKYPSSWIVAVYGSDGISIARNRGAEQFVGKPVSREIYGESRKKRTGLLKHVTRDKIPVYSAFTHPTRADWTVVIAVPQEEIEAAAKRTAWYAALAAVLTLALASCIIYFLGRRLSRSLNNAVHSAKMLTMGQIPEIKPSKVEEIEVLQSTLREVGMTLIRQNEVRHALETERERLLQSEQEARKTAEGQNRAKDEFLAMLGHELRNPLAAISGAFMVMEMANARPEQTERAFEVARRQTGHLAKIVDDLLDVARIMEGKVTLKKERIELSAFMHHCIESQRTLNPYHRWEVRLLSAWIEADCTRLEQIIGNVLANALKYTPAGGRITVAMHKEDGDIAVTINDTGIGIHEDLLPRIFDVFVQGPTTIDRSTGGLGLGLALVKKLIALHDGSVMASSPGENQGSTFILRLPQQDAPQLAPSIPQSNSAPANRHILVVEDNADGRDIMTTLLRLQGFDVTAVENGEQALDAVKHHAPVVAILDIGLPGMNGYELARRLKADDAAKDIYLIALTGYGLDEDRRQAMDAGFAEHLTKPFSLLQLLKAVEDALSGKHGKLDEAALPETR